MTSESDDDCILVQDEGLLPGQPRLSERGQRAFLQIHAIWRSLMESAQEVREYLEEHGQHLTEDQKLDAFMAAARPIAEATLLAPVDRQPPSKQPRFKGSFSDDESPVEECFVEEQGEASVAYYLRLSTVQVRKDELSCNQPPRPITSGLPVVLRQEAAKFDWPSFVNEMSSSATACRDPLDALLRTTICPHCDKPVRDGSSVRLKNRAKVAKCSHIICTLCLERLSEKLTLQCPLCESRFTSASCHSLFLS